METTNALSKTDENEHLVEGGKFDNNPEETFAIRVGCGSLYVIIVHDGKHRFRRLFIPRNSKFHCDLVVRDALARLATYQGKRNMGQLIKDLKGDKFGHRCEKFTVLCEAASCFDAVSKALEHWRGKDEKAQKDNKEKEA